MLLSVPDETAPLRVRLAEQERELAALREAASDAAETAAARLRAARQDAAALRRALDETMQALAARPEADEAAQPEVQEAASVPLPALAPPSAPQQHSLRRAAALPIWRLIRPIARPLLWRTRNFLMAGAVHELAELRATQQRMQRAMPGAAREAAEEARPGLALTAALPRRAAHDVPGHGLGLGDTAAERWLLTVALDGAQARDSLEGA